MIVDHNKLQSDTWVSQVSDLGDLEAKVAAFGWAVDRCDGHDLAEVRTALARLEAHSAGRPKLLVADTVKGRGVSFMEPHELPLAGDSLYGFHSGAPSAMDYERAAQQLRERLNERLEDIGTEPVQLEDAGAPQRPPVPARSQKLIARYADALAAEAAAPMRASWRSMATCRWTPA